MKLRSWNPRLLEHFAQLPKKSHFYNFKAICDPYACQQVIDRMDLKKKYPNSKGNLDIVDVFSGSGLFSSMLNYELKPRNHVILEKEKNHVKAWQSRMEFLLGHGNNEENFRFFNLDGYNWDSYKKLIEDHKAIIPLKQDRSKIHDQLLIVANLTSASNGESLLAQWIQCCAHRNWLQKYGRVRMLFFIRNATSQKFLSSATFLKRNRAALKRDIYTESHLLAVSDSSDPKELSPGEGFDPQLLFDDQPLLLHKAAVAPTSGDLSVVEIVPRTDLQNLDVHEVDFLCQVLMYKSHLTTLETLSIVAPGAAEDLGGKIREEILQKKPRNLTREEFLEIYHVYHSWAFKPSYEDTIDIFMEDQRSF